MAGITEVRRYPNYIYVKYANGTSRTYGLHNTPKIVWDHLEYFQEKGRVRYQGQATIYEGDESDESVRIR